MSTEASARTKHHSESELMSCLCSQVQEQEPRPRPAFSRPHQLGGRPWALLTLMRSFSFCHFSASSSISMILSCNCSFCSDSSVCREGAGVGGEVRGRKWKRSRESGRRTNIFLEILWQMSAYVSLARTDHWPSLALLSGRWQERR